MLSFTSISEEDFSKSAFSNQHISKASLWKPGMQESTQCWAQNWHKASIQKQFPHKL
jgi:hypothetical protein